VTTLADGDRLRMAGDLNGALGIYTAVYRTSPSPESLQRVASALDLMGRYAEAYSAYKTLLETYGNQIAASQRSAAEARLRGLDELTGTLVFEHLDASTSVRLDGHPIATAQLTKPFRANRGSHQVELTGQGRAPKNVQVVVGANEQHVDASLEPLLGTGTLAITATPAGDAMLFVDGKAIGPLPQRLELSKGQHEVTALGARVEARPVRVQVESGKTMSLGLNLVPKPGLFEIDPVAPDAVLVVDQQAVGSGKRTLSLSAGRHVLELRRPGYQTQRLTLTVQPGEQQHLSAGAYVRDKNAPVPAVEAGKPQAASPPETQSNPPALAEQPAASSPYTGIFGSFVVPIMLGGKSTHSYVDDCPAKTYGGACTTSAPRGGGLGLRLGYFYEWIGLELMGAGAVDVSTTELKLPPIPTISSSMQDLAGRSVFVRAGGMFGAGLRLAVPMQGLRFTVGADYLYIYRKVIAIPDSFAGANLSYSVPGWFIDGGIQLGSTPGARFYIGAFALIEQAHDLPLTRNLSALGVDPTLIPAELTKVTVYRGRQVFYGPLLGIAFGH
jgi:hypothetical protein